MLPFLGAESLVPIGSLLMLRIIGGAGVTFDIWETVFLVVSSSSVKSMRFTTLFTEMGADGCLTLGDCGALPCDASAGRWGIGEGMGIRGGTSGLGGLPGPLCTGE